MSKILQYMLSTMTKIAGQKQTKRIISEMAQSAKIDLLLLAYNNRGILKYENNMVSGEHYLLHKVLKQNLADIQQPILFDVGANVGNYSLLLSQVFSQAQIYAFEPNEETYQQLTAKVGHAVKCIKMGLGREEKTEKLYTYADNLTAGHASTYGEILSTLHKSDNVMEMDFHLSTIDHFCEREAIPKIDFLKIDTEGNELKVLEGAKKMLSGGKIKIIQFEFGECDVFSRVFLKDFYEMLVDYNIYRLNTERLIPLFEYNLNNEIFHYQNFIAVRKDIHFQPT